MGALDRLPVEIFEEICQCIDANDRENVTSGSRQLRQLGSRMLQEHRKLKEQWQHVFCSNDKEQLKHSDVILEIWKKPHIASYIRKLTSEEHTGLDIISEKLNPHRYHAEDQQMISQIYDEIGPPHYQEPIGCTIRPGEQTYLDALLQLLSHLNRIELHNGYIPDTRYFHQHQLENLPSSIRDKDLPKPSKFLGKIERADVNLIGRPESRSVTNFGFEDCVMPGTVLEPSYYLPFAFLPNIKELSFEGLHSHLSTIDYPQQPFSSTVASLTLRSCFLPVRTMYEFLNIFPNLEELSWDDGRRVSEDVQARYIDAHHLCPILHERDKDRKCKSIRKLTLRQDPRKCYLLDRLRGLSMLKCLETEQPALIDFEKGEVAELPQALEELCVRYEHRDSTELGWFKQNLVDIILSKEKKSPQLKLLSVIAAIDGDDATAIGQLQSYSGFARQCTSYGVQFKILLERDGKVTGGAELAKVLLPTQ